MSGASVGSFAGQSLAKVSSMAANGQQQGRDKCTSYFQMPLHYPRFTKGDYQTMPEWQLDCLLSQYGLPVTGDLAHKREFAMGSFLWSSHEKSA